MNLAQEPSMPVAGLWAYVWKLLRLQGVITWRTFLRSSRRRKIGSLILLVGLLALVGFLFWGSWQLLKFLTSAEFKSVVGDPGPFLDSLPPLFLGGSFVGILLTSFGVLLQALYLSNDMDFLLSAPVPIRAVFVAKLMLAILPNLTLTAAFGLPVLYGLGAVRGYNLLYYPLLLLALILLALAAAGAASLLVMAVVRVVPARRVAEVLGFFGAVFSLLCSQSGQLANWSDPEQLDSVSLNAPMSLLERFNQPWSPLAWAGRGLVDLGEGRWLSGILFYGLALAAAGALFYVCLQTAERLYYSGWASIQISATKKKAPRGLAAQPQAVPTAQANAWASWWDEQIPRAVRGIVWKDLQLLRRDLRNLSSVMTAIIFGLIYTVSLLRSGPDAAVGRGEAPEWFMQTAREVASYGTVAISLFIASILSGRLAMLGFSMEGRSYWILKTAPLSRGRLVAAKFLAAYLPSLTLGWLYLIVVFLIHPASGSVLIYGFLVVAFCLGGSVSLSLGFGIKGANLEWIDPRQMQSSAGGCLNSVAGLVFLIVTLAGFFALPALLRGLGLPLMWAQGAGLFVGGGLCVAMGGGVLWWATPHVDRIGE